MENSRIEFIAAPVEAFLKDATESIPQQIKYFRENWFNQFLTAAFDEVPMTLYGSRVIPTPEGEKDCIFFGVIPDKDIVQGLIEHMLMDGCQWVIHISEAHRWEAYEDGSKKPGTKRECLLVASYASGWNEMALHSFDRPKGEPPVPIGGWEVHGTDDGMTIGGALVPFSDDSEQKGH